MSYRRRNSLSSRQVQKTSISLKKIVITGSAFLTLLVIGFIYFNFSNQRAAYAAVNGDYQSIGSGAWSNIAIWQKYNGASWVPAVTAPTSLDGTITIQNGHTVTVTAAVTVDQMIIDAGGILVVNTGIMTVANGSGNDLTVNGTLTLFSTLSLSASANVDVNNLATLKSSGTISFIGSSVINVNGRFKREGGTMPITPANWSINNGGTFEHAMNGGTLLQSRSWKVGSNCDVTGVTTTVPGNINMVFYNFIWNCPAQTAGFNFNAKFDWVNGDLTIISTGAAALQFDFQGNNNTTNIAGNFNMQGGNSLWMCKRERFI